MKIGTVEVEDEAAKPKRSRPSLSGSSGSSGGKGGGRGPNGDGGDNGGGSSEPPALGDPDRSAQFIPDKSRILTMFLLLVVMMTFGGLIGAYVVIATNKSSEWQPFELPLSVWISTVLIGFSSLIYHFGKKAVDRNDQPAAKRWFVLTTVLGAAFISSQLLAYFALNARGLYVEGNPYTGFFYLLTGVHAVHVIGGIIALGSILLRNLVPTERLVEIARRQTLAQVVGWYWHFMGVLWLLLFVLLGFWK